MEFAFADGFGWSRSPQGFGTSLLAGVSHVVVESVTWRFARAVGTGFANGVTPRPYVTRTNFAIDGTPRESSATR